MGITIVALLPFIIGSAVIPVQITVDILLLRSHKQGLLKASAYVAGLTTIRLLQGLIFSWILIGDASAPARRGNAQGPVVSTLLLVLGILLLTTAYRQWSKQADRITRLPSG